MSSSMITRIDSAIQDLESDLAVVETLKEKFQRAIRNQGFVLAYRLPTVEDRNGPWIGFGPDFKGKGNQVAQAIEYVALSYNVWHSFITGREWKYTLIGISSDFKLIGISGKFEACSFESHEAAKEAWKGSNEWIDIA